MGPVHPAGNEACKLYLVIQSNQCSELPTPPLLIEFNICYKRFITSLLQIVFSLIIIIKSFHEDELSLKLLVHHNTDFNGIIREMIVLKQTARRRLLCSCCWGSSLPSLFPPSSGLNVSEHSPAWPGHNQITVMIRNSRQFW